MVVVVSRRCGTFLTGPHYTISLYHKLHLNLPLVHFARSFLKTPLKPFAVSSRTWCSRFKENKVYTEFVIINGVIGVELERSMNQAHTSTIPLEKCLPETQ